MTNTAAPRTTKHPAPNIKAGARGTVQYSQRLNRAGLAVALVTACVLMLVPLVWMVSIAFTPPEQAFGEMGLIPAEPTLENFDTALNDANLLTALRNSAIIAVIVVTLNCVLAILAGYAFAMLPFRGSTAVFWTLIATTAIPSSVTLIPQFLMTRAIPLAGGNDIFGQGGSGLLDTIPGLALPHLVSAMNIFLARQYFQSASPDLGEAARIDGASEWRIFAGIYLPLAKPLVAVVGIFAFTAVWDDFLWPLVITTSRESQTVQLALASFRSDGIVQYGPLMAGALLVSLPVIAIFLIYQRGFISGLSEGSVKG